MSSTLLTAPPENDSQSTLTPCVACGSQAAEFMLQAPDRFHGRSEWYTLLRCTECSLVWLDSPPSPERIGEHYGREYDSFIRAATERRRDDHWRGPVTTLHRFKQGGALLDLGCGSGSFLESVQNRAWRLHGIEMSGEAAARARSRTGSVVHTGDILNAPFMPASFDAVTCFHLMEHVHQPILVFNKIAEWLRPGGILCMQVPNIESAEARLFQSYWYPLELPRHLYHFSMKALLHMAHGCGFLPLETRTLRHSFFEASSRYVIDEQLRRIGIARRPLASAPPPTLPWRIVRKGLRHTAFNLVDRVLAYKGEGQIIEAVFQKPVRAQAI